MCAVRAADPAATVRRAGGAAIAALAVMALIWGYNWVVMKRAVAEVDPFDFLAWRLSIAAGCLFATCVALRRPLAVENVASTAAIGLIHTALTFALMVWALRTGAAGKSAVISYSMPFFVVLLAWPVLDERPTPLQWAAIALALPGLVLLVNPRAGAGRAEALAFASGLTWAIGVVITRRHQVRHRADTLTLSAWQNAVGAAAMIIAALLFSTRPWHWTPYVAFAVIFNGVIVSAVSWALWFWILGRLDSGIASLGTLAVPVVGVVSGVLELGERPSATEWIGIALVIMSLGLVVAATLRPSRTGVVTANNRGPAPPDSLL